MDLKGLKKMVTVLVVDDEEDLQDVLRYQISRICSKVLVASSAAEAMAILREEPVDLVISDIRMPRTDGFQFFNQLRETLEINQPKFCFLTGGVDLTSVQQEILEKKSDGCFSKPFKEDHIFSTIKNLFPEA